MSSLKQPDLSHNESELFVHFETGVSVYVATFLYIYIYIPLERNKFFTNVIVCVGLILVWKFGFLSI